MKWCWWGQRAMDASDSDAACARTTAVSAVLLTYLSISTESALVDAVAEWWFLMLLYTAFIPVPRNSCLILRPATSASGVICLLHVIIYIFIHQKCWQQRTTIINSKKHCGISTVIYQAAHAGGIFNIKPFNTIWPQLTWQLTAVNVGYKPK